MVSVLALSAGDRGFEPRSGQTKDYKNPTQHVGLVQSGPHHYLIEYSRHDVAERLLNHAIVHRPDKIYSGIGIPVLKFFDF